jgi:hypothetical protein
LLPLMSARRCSRSKVTGSPTTTVSTMNRRAGLSPDPKSRRWPHPRSGPRTVPAAPHPMGAAC